MRPTFLLLLSLALAIPVCLQSALAFEPFNKIQDAHAFMEKHPGSILSYGVVETDGEKAERLEQEAADRRRKRKAEKAYDECVKNSKPGESFSCWSLRGDMWQSYSVSIPRWIVTYEVKP